jgi:hypothetical protein
MSTAIVEEATVAIPLLGAHKTEETMRADAAVHQSVARMFAAITVYFSGAGNSGPVFTEV